jgi:hypothetical protein
MIDWDILRRHDFARDDSDPDKMYRYPAEALVLLNRETGTALEVESMTTAMAAWPGPAGAADRKARIFTRHHVQVAIGRLRTVAPAAS